MSRCIRLAVHRFLKRKVPLCSLMCVIILSTTPSIHAQNTVTIPDPNFAAFLSANFPSCISGNQLDTTCSLVMNVPAINVFNSAIQDLTGIQYFDNLQVLEAQSNLLSSLPKLPSTVTYININNNQFSVLPQLPPNLAQLYCNTNLLTSIIIPPGLNVLSCSSNQITVLPPIPIGLTYLAATNNLLTSLPAMPNSVTSIVVGENQLTSLPTLPPGLQYLSCNGNLLTSLPALPSTITELRCSDNQISSLPPLPPSLSYLGCSTNLLATLPDLPATLNTIAAHDNQLTSLPALPSPFSCSVDISNNPIVCLPFLPDSISLNFCGTNVHCLLNIPEGSEFINCDDTLPPICSGTSDCLPYNISGYAFIDLDNDCQFDASEPPIAGRIIEINSGEAYAYTDSNGYYTFYSGTPGTYQLSQLNPSAFLWDLSCNGNLYSETIVNADDTFNNRNFPNQIISFCSLNVVDVATAAQRLCFSTNSYTVNYCNNGTLTSFNNHIEIEFDPEVIPLSSTLPWTAVTGSIYTFDVGTLSPGTCGSFIITDSVSCDAILEQTACVRAKIFPDSTCEPVSPTWDQSDLVVTGMCNATNDSILFAVKNIGTGDMSSGGQVTIYEDDLIMSIATAQLDSGDSIKIILPATGKTYRVEARQLAGHPGFSQPRSFVELCGILPYSLNKIIPVVQDDADKWVEIDCHLITGSFDPNEKTVQPSGVGTDHLVTPEDELDYIIQFQNTGNDTAFNVLLVDTIDTQYLDITSIQPGSSSHPYVFSLESNNVAKFAFNSIMLPDSNINEPASHGFVKYKIRQQPGNLPGTVINNFADIYFDYNLPVRTDTPYVTIKEKDSIYFEGFPSITVGDYQITTWPNPFEDVIYFKIGGNLVQRDFSVTLFNVLGEEIYSGRKANASTFTISPSLETPGIYFYRIYNNHELIGAGKLIRK